MDFKDAMQIRHTVRKFLDKPIEQDKIDKINSKIIELNEQFNLNMKLILNNNNGIALGWKPIQKNANNFILLAGKLDDQTEENLGYASSVLMLYAQSMYLNSWWIGGMLSKKVKKLSDECVIGILVIGYGENQGRKHSSKSYNDVASYKGNAPQWFKDGVAAALLAPTAINRQAFKISGNENKVKISYKPGPFSFEDLGIVKHHFEIGAGKENFTWK